MPNRRTSSLLSLFLLFIMPCPTMAAAESKPTPELAKHLIRIAGLAQPSPMVTIPAGTFLLGSKRVDGDPYGKWTQFDDTELPQQQVWLDDYEIDREEVSLGEYLSYLQKKKLYPSTELQKLIWHLITVHFVSDQTLTRWPALYVTWAEAQSLCTDKARKASDGSRMGKGSTRSCG
jgi:gamma-glutamyl hercynylcysteine S-oxide synthase